MQLTGIVIDNVVLPAGPDGEAAEPPERRPLRVFDTEAPSVDDWNARQSDRFGFHMNPGRRPVQNLIHRGSLQEAD